MVNTNETSDDDSDYHTETHRVHYDPATSTKLSVTLVKAVADVKDTKPLELEQLQETIDPDTLNEFVESSSTQTLDDHVSFEYEGCRVWIYASGLIEIRPAD